MLEAKPWQRLGPMQGQRENRENGTCQAWGCLMEGPWVAVSKRLKASAFQLCGKWGSVGPETWILGLTCIR